MKLTRIAALLARFEAQLRLEWSSALHGAEKTWFAVYDPADERRIRAVLGEFELATISSGRKWSHVDLTHAMEQWLAASEYRESYFEDPDFLEMQYSEFEQHLAEKVRETIRTADSETLVALTGIGSLFGFARISALVGALAGDVQGRLLVFFPGSVEANTYRLLNARDGWNYRAVVISGDRQ